jgi:hypothetical protein
MRDGVENEDFKGNLGIALTYLGLKSLMKFSIDEFVDH